MFPLQPQFEAIEAQKRDISAQIEALSEAQRSWKANARAWSALQIVEHLVLGEETVGSLAWARGQIEAGAAPRVHPRRFRLILWAMRRDIRLPLPSPALDPRGEASWPALLARWDAAREDLRAHLESPDFDPDDRPFLHPIAGAMSARGLLEMSQIHNAYHARQLARLVASQGV